MAQRLVEVQRTKEIETVSRIHVDVPDAVLKLDDPEALTEWVELNVGQAKLDGAQAVVSEKVSITGADIVME